MRIAVTGAFGFIGRYVVTELERRALHPVLVARPGANRPSHAMKYAVVELDMKRPSPNAFELMGRPDALIHLAWGGLPNYKSMHHFEEELPAQYQFLKGLVHAGLRNLLVTGTCFEYGMQSGALNERLPACPTNPYGHAKDALRVQLQFLQQACPFQLTWARLFYLHGECQPRNSLRAQLEAAVDAGAAAFDMSGGEQLRDYLPVERAASLLASLVLADRDHGVVNVCSGEPISVRSLVERWISHHNWTIALNLGRYPYPDHEPLAFWGDLEKLSACLAADGSQ